MTQSTVAIIVQARMTSTRLPGKILKTVLDKPLLAYELERLQRVRLADQIIMATTVNATDQPVVDLCNTLGILSYRGSEQDVLSRYYEAACQYPSEVIVRITADCPFIEPALVDEVIRLYLEEPQAYDYVSNTHDAGFPVGLATEVFSFNALETAYREASQPYEREHVTPYIYQHPARFRLGHLRSERNLSHNRWTVDTPEDFELIQHILQALYPSHPQFTMDDVLTLLDQNPHWRDINSHIHQKRLTE